jgi:hypothetical protein
LVCETNEINKDRQKCQGIILMLHKNADNIHCITQFKSCRHGRSHPDFKGDELEYSCRKIQMVIVENKNIGVFK